MRWHGWLVVASYLFAGCFLLPWAGEVKDKAEQTGQALAQVGVHPAKERPDPDDRPEHNCACDLSHDNRSPFHWCDADGTRNASGTHACCNDCGKICGQVRAMPYTEPAKRKKPPVPVPLPPDCDLTTHCRGKEECTIGDGRCCTNCHQACL